MGAVVRTTPAVRVDDLQEAHEALGDDGTVLGINVRDYNAQIARDFVKNNGVTCPLDL